MVLVLKHNIDIHYYTTNEGFRRPILTTSVDLPVHPLAVAPSVFLSVAKASLLPTRSTEAARPCTDDLCLIYSLHTAQISSHISVIRSSLD